jgi:hypothetical protein
MHVQPQWANMHFLPPLIDKKRGETKMTPHLAALVKRVVELHNSSLRACHCAEEFTVGGFTLSVIGRSWHMSACGLPIQTMSLLLVEFLTLRLVDDDMSF